VTERTIILPPASNGASHEASYRLTMMVPKRHYLSYLRERWWLVMICVAVAVSGMIVLETVRAVKYTSFAQIYMSGNVELNVGSLFSEESQTYFGTQMELLKSARIQNAAFQKSGITLPPGKMNPYKVEIVQPPKTSILQVQATGPDPDSTQHFLQMLVNEYLAYKKETRLTTSQDVLDSLQDELTKKAADLQAEQDKWAEFQKSNNVVVLEDNGRSAGTYLSDLNLELANARLELSLLNDGQTNAEAGLSDLDATNPIPSSTPGSTTNLVASSEDAASDDDAINTARVDLAQLLANQDLDTVKRMGPRGIEQEATRLQRQIATLVEDKRTRLQKRIAAIQEALPTWETKMLEINDRLSQGQLLKDNVAREQGYYDHLLGMLENVDLGKNVQQEQLSVLQAATPGQPEQRSLPLHIVMAGLGALFFSLGIIFVWYLLDDRFVSFRDIKDQFGETFLGLVPQIKVPRAKPQAVLLENNDARLAYVESYRHLRSALLLASFGENRPQTLLFTSASPDEGKTTIAVNLARLLARSGLRVVLVDADGQGGGMRRLLGDKEEPGVLDYLRGEATAKAIVQPTGLETLLLVPGGTHKEHSEGLFLRPKLAELIQELRQNADFVILDGAPILASDAAALLVPHADMVILVTRPFYTRSRLVRQALDMLYQRQAKHVSIILNRARADDLAGHYAMNGLANHAAANGKI
jgi:capsular exopolysaccharide synthesis family protein